MRTEEEIKDFLNIVMGFHAGYIQMGFSAECKDSMEVMEATLKWVLESEANND